MTFDDTIDSVLSDVEVLQALRRRAEEAVEWLEHKRWHEEDPAHRGEAVLVTGWDTPNQESIERPATDRFEDEPVRKRDSHPLWAGCTCKSPNVKLIFGEDGELRNELPQTIETNAYGVAAADTAVAYLGSNAEAVEYRPSTPSPAPTYTSPSHNAMYK